MLFDGQAEVAEGEFRANKSCRDQPGWLEAKHQTRGWDDPDPRVFISRAAGA